MTSKRSDEYPKQHTSAVYAPGSCPRPIHVCPFCELSTVEIKSQLVESEDGASTLYLRCKYCSWMWVDLYSGDEIILYVKHVQREAAKKRAADLQEFEVYVDRFMNQIWTGRILPMDFGYLGNPDA